MTCQLFTKNKCHCHKCLYDKSPSLMTSNGKQKRKSPKSDPLMIPYEIMAKKGITRSLTELQLKLGKQVKYRSGRAWHSANTRKNNEKHYRGLHKFLCIIGDYDFMHYINSYAV